MCGPKQTTAGRDVAMQVMVHPSTTQLDRGLQLLRVRIVPIPPLGPSGEQHYVIALTDQRDNRCSFWVASPPGLTLEAPLLFFESQLLAQASDFEAGAGVAGDPYATRIPCVRDEYNPETWSPPVSMVDRLAGLYDPTRKPYVESFFREGQGITASRRKKRLLTVHDIDELVLISGFAGEGKRFTEAGDANTKS